MVVLELVIYGTQLDVLSPVASEINLTNLPGIPDHHDGGELAIEGQ